MEIKRKDIDRIGQLLIPGGSFADVMSERYQAIETVDRSIDIDACPGSGKTTCLLAKLILLAEKMPAEDGRGICVITHTNVAIDELKNRIGAKANSLFSYPNHFGTFQSFIDKFLAIPYYAQRYKQRPSAIDSARMAQRLFSIFPENGAKQDVNDVKSFLHAFKKADEITFRHTPEGTYLVVDGLQGPEVEPSKVKKNGPEWSPADKSRLKALLRKMRKSVYRNDSILSFNDAYFLANEYLENRPDLPKVLSLRFGMVFVDEMQDCSSHQLDLIDKLFDTTVIVQKIGDPDQSILGDKIRQWKPSAGFLTINSSKRFNTNIAGILRTVCVKDNLALQGNPDVENLSPYIITYKDDNKGQVLAKFTALIRELNLRELNTDNLPYKAVGWVGDKFDKDKISIQHYFRSFNKSIKKDSGHFTNLKNFLRKLETSNVKQYRDMLFNALLQYLFLAKKRNSKDKRHFTRTSLTAMLLESQPEFLQELLEQFAFWSLKMHLSKTNFNPEVIQTCRAFFKDQVNTAFQIPGNEQLTKFIDGETDEEFSSIEMEELNTYFDKKDGVPDIRVDISTVHGVKGETHAATLYMETCFQGKCCSEYLMDQLCGKAFNPAQKNSVYKATCLKTSYVAMSRPKWLLGFAAHEKNILPHRIALENNGWKILSIE